MKLQIPAIRAAGRPGAVHPIDGGRGQHGWASAAAVEVRDGDERATVAGQPHRTVHGPVECGFGEGEGKTG